jgi:predicted RNA-binding Zn ribbon-like protein
MHEGRVAPGGVIALLNEHLGRSAGRQQLTRVGGEWRLRFAPLRPPAPLEAIARSAAATLADGRVAVRRCSAEGCSLLFTDDSAHGSRRWCDEAECGRDARIERRRGLRR